MSRSPEGRLRLSDDVVFVPSGTGALFRGDGICFTLADAGTYELMRRLAVALRAGRSLDEICSGEDPALHPRIVALVEALAARGIVFAAGDRQTGVVLSGAVRSRFAASLAFIEAIADAPEERFERFRTSAVLLAGDGVSFSHCAAALVRNGLQRLWLVARAPGGSDLRDLDREVDALRSLNITTEAHVLNPTCDLATAGPPSLSLILYVADGLALADLAALGRRALRARCALLPGFLVDDEIVIGPLVRAPACYVCTFARLAHEIWDPARIERLVARLEASGGRLTAPSGPTQSLARRLGGDVAFEALKTLAGSLRPEIERGLTLQTRAANGGIRASFTACTSHWCRGGCRVFSAESERVAAVAP